MTVLTETRHAGEFIVSEANKTRSRKTVTVSSGQNLQAGHVLGQITANSEYIEYDPGNIDGSQTAVAILLESTGGALAAAKEMVVLIRDCEVNSSELTWFTGATGGQITTGLGELENVGIIGR